MRRSILAPCSAERSVHSKLPMFTECLLLLPMQAPEAAAEEASTKSLQDSEQKAATPEAKLWHGQGFHVTPQADTEAKAEHDAKVVRELVEIQKAIPQS